MPRDDHQHQPNAGDRSAGQGSAGQGPAGQGPAGQGSAGQGPDDPSRELFVRLLTQHERRVYAYILSLVPSWHDADEIAQETNVRLWKEFDRFEPGSNFAAWAMRVAHFQILTWRKQATRSKLVFSQEFVELVADQHTVGEGWEAEARHRALGTCIEELSDQNRELLRQCYAEGSKIKQVAQQLDRTTASTYKLLQRIRLALHKCITKHLAAAGPT
jgi:RNA polymerase sigma-70 factor (ECF subfamily)